MILRSAETNDAAALAGLGRESFCAAFAHLYRAADLESFLAEAYDITSIARQICDPAITYRLAQSDTSGALLGFAKLCALSPYRAHSDARNPVALGQLYTDPAHTGEGIGAALMEWALSRAITQGHDAVQLSVWSENHGAQRFYARYGFAKIADIHFMVGTHRDEEFLLELRL